MTVNYMFGILTPRSAQVESYEGYRFSNATANTTQRRLLGKILTFSNDPKQSLLLTDFILKLLSCSPYLPQLIRDLDLYNTYDVSWRYAEVRPNAATAGLGEFVGGHT